MQLDAALMPTAEGAFPRPTPPPSESIAAAIRRLRAIGAIEDDGVAPMSLAVICWWYMIVL